MICLPCLGLLLYFGIASIFVPKYRRYIREGWHCFLDKLKGKKCSVSFDNRMRIAFSAWLTKRGLIKLGKFFYDERNFNLTLTVVTLIFTIISIYLFILLVNFLVSPPCAEGICPV